MKTQLKRLSKSTLAVVLSVCLLISCMTVGIIATDAAKVTESGAIGAKDDSESVGNDEAEYQVNVRYLYINMNTAGSTLNGIGLYWQINDTGDGAFWLGVDKAEEVETGIYKFDLNDTGNASYPYLRKVRVNSYTGDKATWYNASVNGDGNSSTDMITVNADKNGGTWSTYTPSATDYTITSASGGNGTAYISRNTPVTGTDTSVTIQASEGATTVYVKATPAAGYCVSGWQQDGASIPSTATATDNSEVTQSFAVAGASTITPVFSPIPSAKTFYVAKSHSYNWSNIYYYLYGGDIGNSGDWPGTKVAESDLIGTYYGSNVYRVTTATTNASKIILNDGSNNTINKYKDDVAFVDGTLYYTRDNVAAPTTIASFNEANLDKTVTVSCGTGTFSDDTTADKTILANAASDAHTGVLPIVNAPAGYRFKQWNITTGTVTVTNNANDGTGTVTASTNGTVTAEYEEAPDTYFYILDTDKVSNTTNMYLWSGETKPNGDWPGTAIGSTTETIEGKTYFVVTKEIAQTTFSLILNNGGDLDKSADLTDLAYRTKHYIKWTSDGIVDSATPYVDNFYLTGWLNGASVTTTDNSRKFTKQQDGTYTLDYIFTGNQGGSQYVTIFDGTNAYHPVTHPGASGAAGTTVNTSPGNDPKWKVDATTDQTAHFTFNPNTKVLSWTVDSLATTYRVVGSATFFGTAWDTSTASTSYKYMMRASSGTQTADGTSFTYDYSSGPHNASVAYGSFDFKVFGTDNSWNPSANVTVPGLKKDQQIYFYFNSDTGAVTYAIVGNGTEDPWPPTDITTLNPGDVQYNSLIYNISGGSNNITSNKSTLDNLKQVKSVADTGNGGWWADFTDILPNIGTNQLYFNITSNGSYTGFYSTSNMTFDTTNAPGISVKKVDKDSSKYFVEVSGVDSALTHLGVYITKDGSNNFTYKFYTVKGSTSGGKTVKVYAKDGSIRRLGTSRDPRSNITYSTFEQHANTFLCSDNTYATRLNGAGRASTHGASGTDEWTDSTTFDRYTYDYAAGVTKGSTIYIKTVLKNDDYMNQYYLAGYSINGTTYVEHTVSESETGTVTESFTIPEDWEWNYVEITPIYFLRDNSNTIKFYVEGYDQTVMDAGWGNTVGVYPYYQDPTNNSQVANVNNPFGGYPGQPLMFYKGNYYAVLPKSYQAYTEAHTSGEKVNCEIKGVTLSNMYWDDVHLYTGEVSSHFQTYDFDDLYKIYKEYGNDVNNIICAFKYRTQKNNDEPNSVTPANYTNGWEVLKDYYGNPIDVFGNQLTGDALTAANAITTPEQAQNASGVVRVISQDYKSNCAGQYATEYAIYDTTGAQVKVSGGKSTIVPSALAIKTANNFDNYDPATKSFKAIYQALDNNSKVKGKPVVITYEKSIYGGGDKADRCDARWFFSKRGEAVNATTRIEYSDDLGATWTTDSFNSGTATGSHTGSTAYFTGLSTAADNDPETAAGNTTTTDTSTNSSLTPHIGEGYYVFNATAGAQYEFVGWYILRENYQQNADKNHLTSHAEIAKDGDIFVARFVKTAHGSFTINHKLHPQSSGFGDVYVQATVKNSGNTLYTIGSVDPNNNPTSTVTIEKDGNDNDLIVSGHGNVIEAKFVPDPYGTSSFVNFYATINDLLNGYTGYDFIKSIEINMPGVDGYDSSKGIYALVTYDVDKMFAASSGTPTQIYTSVTHYSKFALKTDINYRLSYKFKTRYYGDKLYNYNSTFTEEELRSYFYDQITNKATTTIALDKQFVFSKAPQESNFRQDLTWRIGDVTIENNVGKMTAYQVDKKTVDGVVYDSEISGGKYAEVTTRMTTGYMKLFSIKENATNETAEAFDPSDDDLYRPKRTTYLDNREEKPVYIHHWDMYQLDTFSYDGFDAIGNLNVSDKAVLVAQSYSSKMNYVGFEDYAIVPVYSTELANRQEISDNRTDASATLLSITRNHWNTTTSGEADNYGHYDAPNTNYDRLYVDFMLNYNYSTTVDGKKQNIMLSKTGENIKVGFVVRSYTVVNGAKVYREGKSQTVLIDKSKIDDKNRLEYCYGFNNTQNNSQWGLNFEFTPFIVDTSVQTTESAALINISGTNYKTLYPATDFKCLDGVTFYMIGKADTDWA